MRAYHRICTLISLLEANCGVAVQPANAAVIISAAVEMDLETEAGLNIICRQDNISIEPT